MTYDHEPLRYSTGRGLGGRKPWGVYFSRDGNLMHAVEIERFTSWKAAAAFAKDQNAGDHGWARKIVR